MGLVVSQEIHDKCEEYEIRNYAYPYCWKDLGSKNFDYYNNKRFCKISRGFYPHIYSNGYLYGRKYNPEYYKKLGWEYDEELDIWKEIPIEREF